MTNNIFIFIYNYYVINLESSIALTENFSYRDIETDIRLGIYNEGETSTYIEFIFVTNTIISLIILFLIVFLLFYFYNQNK